MTRKRCIFGMRRATCGLLLWLPILLWTGCVELAPPEAPPNGNPPPGPGSDPTPDPPPNQGSLALTRAPYLQMLGESGVLIAFRTSTAVVAAVEYGTTLGSNDGRASSASGTRHAIELQGLRPGQRYYYRIRAGEATLAEGADHFFETDAGASDPEFSFFTTGDIGEPGGKQALTADRILRTTPRAEMGLLCGDVIYPDGESSGYDAHLMRPWAPLLRSVAVWPALGNHDWHVNPDQNFAQEWYLPNNEHYYSFDRGNAHFIALDTRDGDIYDRERQIAWLRADLAAHRDAGWIFAYYHHPGITCTYKGYNDAVIANFHPLFDEYGVDMVFLGHAHTYERMYPLRNGIPLHQDQEPDYHDPQGTIYVVSGCGAKLQCSTTRDCAVNATQIDCTILFTHVTVRGKQLTLRTIESATGTERDRITVTKSR